MRYSTRKLSNDKVITTACNFSRQIACSFQVMSGNIIFLGKKIFQIPPFFQTRPGDLGKKVNACSLRFSALNPEDWFGTPTWPPFHCFGTPIWPPLRHVKTHYKHKSSLPLAVCFCLNYKQTGSSVQS